MPLRPRPLSRSLALACALFVTAVAATAQEVPDPQRNSPFSRFGVGDLSPHAYAAQLGLGGIGIAYNDPRIASPTNPASLAAVRFAAYQVGFDIDRSRLSANGAENTSTDGNLSYLSLAFPLQNTLNDVLDGRSAKWRNAMMFSLSPYSTVGYNVQLAGSDPELGDVVNDFRGSGGYYRLQWGNAVKYDDLRVGLNLSYIFGRTNTQRRVSLPDQSGSSPLTETDGLRARGIEVQFGGQYDLVLATTDDRPTRMLTFGATGTLANTLRGDGQRFVTTQTVFGRTDTLVNRTVGDEIRLPAQLGVGVFYNYFDHWSAGLDVTRVPWSSYRSTLRPDERLADATQVQAGVQWVPDFQAFGKFWPRVAYRVGGYLKADPRPNVDPDLGFTLGFGIPVVRPREELSYVNVSLNAGRFGSDVGISQRYARLTVGFTLTDNSWFYKRRFN